MNLRHSNQLSEGLRPVAASRQSAAVASFQEWRRTAETPLRRDYHPAERASVLVIVLLICFGLISITLYFANSMSLELRASDNRVSSLSADQAIEGAARYVSYVLATYATNGMVPDPGDYLAEAVPVGNSTKPGENARFWLIGRDPNGTSLTEPVFGLVAENSKLDLNAAWLNNADRLSTNLARMSYDFAGAIVDWKNTNGGSSSLSYGQAGYLPKQAPFETVEELRLVYGATLDILVGEDLNRNGVLDANEQNQLGGGQLEPGVLEAFTVYSLDPNTYTNSAALTNVNTASRQDLASLIQRSGAGSSVASAVYTAIHPDGNSAPCRSLLDFYIRCKNAGMNADQFAVIYYDLTVTNTSVVGRVNVNTAPAEVLACLPGMNADTAQIVVNYREANPASLTSIAWIADALGDSPQRTALAAGDYVTVKSHQFTADIAAVGPFGRGYRRVKFVFDTSSGTPKIIYRQDLSRFGWALGRKTRETWVAQNTR